MFGPRARNHRIAYSDELSKRRSIRTPSLLVGEGWGGGFRAASSRATAPYPSPPPRWGEGVSFPHACNVEARSEVWGDAERGASLANRVQPNRYALSHELVATSGEVGDGPGKDEGILTLREFLAQYVDGRVVERDVVCRFGQPFVRFLHRQWFRRRCPRHTGSAGGPVRIQRGDIANDPSRVFGVGHRLAVGHQLIERPVGIVPFRRGHGVGEPPVDALSEVHRLRTPRRAQAIPDRRVPRAKVDAWAPWGSRPADAQNAGGSRVRSTDARSRVGNAPRISPDRTDGRPTEGRDNVKRHCAECDGMNPEPSTGAQADRRRHERDHSDQPRKRPEDVR